MELLPMQKRPPVRAKSTPIPRSDLLLAAALVLTTLLAYWPALNGGMLWDDDGHVTRKGLQSLHGLYRIWFDVGASQQYYPFLHSAFWVEHRIWGDAVLGYHLTNVFLHAGAALLVVAIVKRLAIPGAWLAGFLFALHPVCVEAVAWISEQKSTLSAVFYLSAFLVYLHFDASRKRSQYWIAFGLFVLALLSKTVTATMPAALLVVFWWKRGTLDRERDAMPLAPFFGVGVAAGLFTVWVEHSVIGANGSDFSLSLPQRFLLAGRVIWFYLSKLIWPADLMFFYPHWTIDSGEVWQYLFPLGVIAVLAGLAVYARQHRGPLAAFLLFAGTLFPVLGFFNVYPFVYSYVADHFQYLASLAIIVPAAWAITIATRKQLAPGVIPVALLAFLTWRETHMYRDIQTLYTESIARNPKSWIAENNLGNYILVSRKNGPGAIPHLNAALKLKPDSAEAHNNLGSAYSRMPGRDGDAVAEFETAIRLNPKLAMAHSNLGSTLGKLPGHTAEAIEHLRTAIRLKPDLADAHNNLGIILSQTPDRIPEAISEYETALALDPDSGEAHGNLAVALAKTPGRVQESLPEYEAAIARTPDSAEAHSNLGSAFGELGRIPEALEQLHTSLRLNPNSADAHLNLGIVLTRAGHPEEAVSEYEAALKIRPDFVDAHNNLGTLLAQTGHVREALPHFAAAVQGNPNSFEARMNYGNALEEAPGRTSDAIAQYEAAVKINPAIAEGHFYLGLLLMKTPGHAAGALEQFETGLKIKPDPDIQQAVEHLRRAR
jgi:tetratricopeptide (TPR) repeat protein